MRAAMTMVRLDILCLAVVGIGVISLIFEGDNEGADVQVVEDVFVRALRRAVVGKDGCCSNLSECGMDAVFSAIGELCSCAEFWIMVRT